MSWDKYLLIGIVCIGAAMVLIAVQLTLTLLAASGHYP